MLETLINEMRLFFVTGSNCGEDLYQCDRARERRGKREGEKENVCVFVCNG